MQNLLVDLDKGNSFQRTSTQMKKQTVLLFAAGLLGFLSVLLGASGKHALKDQMGTELYSGFETGLRYHQIHAVALLSIAIGSLVVNNPKQAGQLRLAGYLILAGILVFCGSLYGLAFSGNMSLGKITPAGGFLFMLGWLGVCRASLCSEP
jgi:uncharacterized membrane protein YgdD (TMEM256/DUF423 family)